MYNNHCIKCLPEYFEDISNGSKNFELRKDDRNYKVGENVLLMEWNPIDQAYTGKELRVLITYKLTGGKFGLKHGYCIFSFKK